MSTTIGFGVSTTDDDGMFDGLKMLSESYGYGLLRGSEYADSDVQSGLEVMRRNEGWNELFFLQSPINSGVGFAFGIHEELVALETHGVKPKVFEFLTEAAALFSKKKCSKVGIFFAGEWYEKDRVKYSYGTIERLVDILSLPGSWGTRYMIPESGRLQDSDETPFVFDLANPS